MHLRESLRHPGTMRSRLLRSHRALTMRTVNVVELGACPGSRVVKKNGKSTKVAEMVFCPKPWSHHCVHLLFLGFGPWATGLSPHEKSFHHQSPSANLSCTGGRRKREQGRTQQSHPGLPSALALVHAIWPTAWL